MKNLTRSIKVKFKDLRDRTPSQDVPKVHCSEIETLWVSDYWDGPISGMLKYQNTLYWFEMIQENENWKEGDWYRRFAIIKLSNAQLEKALEVHEDFQRYVGTHYDKKQLKTPPNFEEGKKNEFYDKHSEYIQSKLFEDNEVIGWMED